MVRQFILNMWYKSSWKYIAYLFFPLSLIFYFIIFIRKQCYCLGVFKTFLPNVPLSVVGNITVGGTGKTPFVIAFAEKLRAQGLAIGIISRGMGNYCGADPLEVLPNMDAHIAGDEAVLIAKRNLAPVFIHKNRVLALQALLKKYHCDCVISDDGLQHLRLGRTQEIVLIDAERGLGNQLLLPAGPLREPVFRLKTIKWLLSRGGQFQDAIPFYIKPIQFISILHPEKKYPLNYFSGKKAIAIAGIAHPELFFKQLKELHIEIEARSFPDHAVLQEKHFQSFHSSIILMTEKDAVKCQAFAKENMYYLEISADVPNFTFNEIIADLLKRRL